MNSDGMHVYTKLYLDGSEIDQGKIRYLTIRVSPTGFLQSYLDAKLKINEF